MWRRCLLLPPPHVKVLQISLQIAKCIKVQVHGEDTKKQLQHYYCSLCIYHSIDVKIDEPCCVANIETDC